MRRSVPNNVRIRTRAVPALVLAAALALVAGACSGSSSDGGATTTTAARSTTTAPAKADPAYAKRGPHQVGVRTLALDDGRRVVAWYPATDAARDQPTETFDIASLLSPQLQSQIPAELRPQYEIDAHPGAAADSEDGPYPVVLFSHGFAGFPEQSADLVVHLASWGFVVVAPDHVERSLSGLLGTAAQGVSRRDDTDVLSAALDAAVADAKVGGSPLAGILDLDRVAVAGHSAGAYAAYREATADPRIKAFVAYALGTGQPDAQGKVPEVPVPKVPGLVMLGTADGIIPAATTRKVYDAMTGPKAKVEIDGAGHLVFADICLIGKDQGGLVALTKQAGLDLPANLLRLASDGCQPGALDPTKAFAAIDHLTVAFLRHELGIDPEPVGLDQATAASFDQAGATFTGDLG
jgi:predicted dienelactone hydrolase